MRGAMLWIAIGALSVLLTITIGIVPRLVEAVERL